MRLLDDERGQSVQVGAAILLGFVVIAITIYQVQVVSSQNAEVEFNHDQAVRDDFTELRNSIVDAGSPGESDSASVKLGGRYPPRTIFVNPAPIRGSIETQPAGNVSFGNVEVEGSYGGEGSARELVTGNHTTKRVVYAPRYAELDDAGVTSLEHSLAFKSFENGATDPLTRQNVVGGDSLSLTILQGDLSEQGTQSISLDPETVSGPTDPVTVTNDSAGPLELYLPTETPSIWNETVGRSFGDNGARVETYRDGRLTVALAPGEYDLQMALVAAHGQGESTGRYDVRDESSSDDGGGGGTYDLRWDTAEMDAETGLSCSANDCTYNLARSPIPVTVNTSPAVGGAAVDYSIEFTDANDVAAFDPGAADTDGTGRAASELRATAATDGDEVYLHVNGAGDGDRLRVDFERGALFDVSIMDTNGPVADGEELRVDVAVENTGDARNTQDVVLDFDGDGSIEDVRTLTLESGESRSFTLAYNVSGNSRGEHDIEVRSEDDVARTSVSVVGSGPFFDIRDLQTPASAEAGETITVDATVENVGTEQATQPVGCVFDDASGPSTDVTLERDESASVSFDYEVPADQPGGRYDHGVSSSNDSVTRPFTVQVPPTLDSMGVDDQSTCSNGWCSEVSYDVSWAVSDENGDLENVTVNMYTRQGQQRDGSTTTVDGAADSGQLTFSTQNPWTNEHTIEVVVSDEGGRTDVVERDVTAGGN